MKMNKIKIEFMLHLYVTNKNYDVNIQNSVSEVDQWRMKVLVTQ